MMKYYGKSRLYKALKQMYPIPLNSMKYGKYVSMCGIEWLIIRDSEYNKVKIYVSGSWYSLTIYDDEDKENHYKVHYDMDIFE